MERRLGFVGILIEDRHSVASQINSILSDFGGIIKARMGLPHLQEEHSVITLIVEATTDELGALTGRLGKIKGVSVKSALIKIHKK